MNTLPILSTLRLRLNLFFASRRPVPGVKSMDWAAGFPHANRARRPYVRGKALLTYGKPALKSNTFLIKGAFLSRQWGPL